MTEKHFIPIFHSELNFLYRCVCSPMETLTSWYQSFQQNTFFQLLYIYENKKCGEEYSEISITTKIGHFGSFPRLANSCRHGIIINNLLHLSLPLGFALISVVTEQVGIFSICMIAFPTMHMRGKRCGQGILSPHPPPIIFIQHIPNFQLT